MRGCIKTFGREFLAFVATAGLIFAIVVRIAPLLGAYQ